VSVTPKGARALKTAPSLLQDRFRAQLAQLEDWERTQMLALLQRLASMMDAEAIDAAPLLEVGKLANPDAPKASPDGDPELPKTQRQRSDSQPDR
jgi:hypothetical protein